MNISALSIIFTFKLGKTLSIYHPDSRQISIPEIVTRPLPGLGSTA